MRRREFLKRLGVVGGALAGVPIVLADQGRGVAGSILASKAGDAGSSPVGPANPPQYIERNGMVRCAVTDAPNRPMPLPGDSVMLVRHIRRDIPLVIRALPSDEIFGAVVRLERRAGERWGAWVALCPIQPRSEVKFTTYETGDVVYNSSDGGMWICTDVGMGK